MRRTALPILFAMLIASSLLRSEDFYKSFMGVKFGSNPQEVYTALDDKGWTVIKEHGEYVVYDVSLEDIDVKKITLFFTDRYCNDIPLPIASEEDASHLYFHAVVIDYQQKDYKNMTEYIKANIGVPTNQSELCIQPEGKLPRAGYIFEWLGDTGREVTNVFEGSEDEICKTILGVHFRFTSHFPDYPAREYKKPVFAPGRRTE